MNLTYLHLATADAGRVLPPLPPGIMNPSQLIVFNTIIPIVGTLVILWAIMKSFKAGYLTWSFLFIVNSALVFWQETIGDWGQHLVYSPQFWHHNLLDWIPWKTPYDPVFMPFAYACYWTIHAVALMWLVDKVRPRYGWSVLKSVIILSIPVNFLWDGFEEAFAVYMGWWTYDPGFGPVIEFASGTRWPMLWPITLMIIWPNLVTYLGGKPQQKGLNLIEKMFGLGKWVEVSGAQPSREAGLGYSITVPRWKFESARFAAWFITFQVTFFVTLIVPLVALRVLTGHHSIYVP